MPLLEAAQNGLLPKYLQPATDELDALIGNLLADALGSAAGATNLTFVRRILHVAGEPTHFLLLYRESSPSVFADHFLSAKGFDALLQSIVSAFTFQVDHALRDPTISLLSFEAPLDLIRSAFDHRPQLMSSGEVTVALLPAMFTLAYLLPRCYESQDNLGVNTAQDLWSRWLVQSPTNLQVEILTAIKVRLRNLLGDSQVRLT